MTSWTDPEPPPGWTIPDGYRFAGLSICRGCRRAIVWTRTPAGRNAPLDRDGTSHFATCPEADRYRRRSRFHR